MAYYSANIIKKSNLNMNMIKLCSLFTKGWFSSRSGFSSNKILKFDVWNPKSIRFSGLVSSQWRKSFGVFSVKNINRYLIRRGN